MGGRGSNSTDRLKRGGRGGKSLDAQARALAKEGKMPKFIAGGTAEEQNKAFEAINKAFKYTPEQEAVKAALDVTDQSENGRLYIRKPDGSVAVQTYPQGASKSAKDGALKMYIYNNAGNIKVGKSEVEVRTLAAGSNTRNIKKRFEDAGYEVRNVRDGRKLDGEYSFGIKDKDNPDRAYRVTRAYKIVDNKKIYSNEFWVSPMTKLPRRR